MTLAALGARVSRAGSGRGWPLFAFIVAALVAVPVLVVLLSVFAPATEVWSHLVDTVLGRYLENTFWLVVGVGLSTLVTGTVTAWLVTTCRFPGRRIFEIALLLPLAVPSYAIAFTYAGLFDFAGPVQSGLRELFGWSRQDYWFPPIHSTFGAFLVMGLVLYPYVYLLARAAFLEQSVCVLEASRVLGRSAWQSFVQVALPLARPAIVTGVALALMEALSDFGAVDFLAVDTFTTGIFRTWFGLGDPQSAAQLSAMLLAVVFVILALERYSRGQAKYFHTTTRYRPLPGYQLNGWRRVLAILACALPVTFGFLLPGGQLLVWAIRTAPQMVDASFVRLAWNSVALAAVAAAVAVAIATTLAYAARLRPSRPMTLSTRLASIGYAVPGSVLAVGVLVPFAWVDNRIDDWAREVLGISTGLILSGTLFALIFAYVVRFLAVSFNTAEAGLAKVTPSIDGAARTLGAGPRETLRRVHVPMIGGSLITAGLLVFVDVMKELPATLIMRPFNFNTLAVRAYELAHDERLADSASAVLAIVLVGIVPVYLLSRAIAGARPGSSS
ncbi:MAG: iron ABC transporter permease [Alphaproteobacteria bacterium]|nr:iron ABC transporter permease [Alphaproteobacteria bacterium]